MSQDINPIISQDMIPILNELKKYRLNSIEIKELITYQEHKIEENYNNIKNCLKLITKYENEIKLDVFQINNLNALLDLYSEKSKGNIIN